MTIDISFDFNFWLNKYQFNFYTPEEC